MNLFRVEKYTKNAKNQWNDFVRNSKNGSFLFHRDFMEYHADRFEDFSLMVFKERSLICVLPAHKNELVISSHMGLTYGGFIFHKKQKLTQINEIFKSVCHFLSKAGLKSFRIKIIPQIYQNQYSSAIEYLLFQRDAKLIRRDLNFVIDLKQELNIHKSKKKILNRDFSDFKIEETKKLDSFWEEVLIPVLKEKYNSQPVHNLQEINYLKQLFPKNIKQYNLLYQNQIIAGLTLFIDNGIVKSQYGAATILGEKFKSLDYLYLKLFDKYQKLNFDYFDLGTTTSADKTYNAGLSNYKEEIGGSPINQDQYLLDL